MMMFVSPVPGRREGLGEGSDMRNSSNQTSAGRRAARGPSIRSSAEILIIQDVQEPRAFHRLGEEVLSGALLETMIRLVCDDLERAPGRERMATSHQGRIAARDPWDVSDTLPDAFAPVFDVVEVDQEPTVNLRRPRPPIALAPAEHGEDVDADVITSARRVAAGSW
jgi:hypothetical protein